MQEKLENDVSINKLQILLLYDSTDLPTGPSR